MNKIEKFVSMSFIAKSNKIDLLKEYARTHKIWLECMMNIPKSSVNDFEKFLLDNDILDADFQDFLDEVEQKPEEVEQKK